MDAVIHEAEVLKTGNHFAMPI